MEHVVKAALINERNEVLILRRSQTDEYRPGETDLPGGCTEPGEQLDTGVVREIQEESGIRLAEEDVRLIYSESGTRKNREIVRYLFLGSVSSQQIVQLSAEHEAWAWHSLPEAIDQFEHLVWQKGLMHLLELYTIDS